MNLQHINVKIFVEGELSVDPERFIDVFHRWVAEQSMEEMLIDVADYRHVPNGPGVLLVGYEADYCIDNADNRTGLRYNCKSEIGGTNADRLSKAFFSAANACLQLEAEFDALRFNRQELEISINDRALAPNNDQSRSECEQYFSEFVNNVFQVSDFQLRFESDARRLCGAVIRFSSPIDWPTPVS